MNVYLLFGIIGVIVLVTCVVAVVIGLKIIKKNYDQYLKED